MFSSKSIWLMMLWIRCILILIEFVDAPDIGIMVLPSFMFWSVCLKIWWLSFDGWVAGRLPAPIMMVRWYTRVWDGYPSQIICCCAIVILFWSSRWLGWRFELAGTVGVMNMRKGWVATVNMSGWAISAPESWQKLPVEAGYDNLFGSQVRSRPTLFVSLYGLC